MSDNIIFLQIFKEGESEGQAEELGSEKQGVGTQLETKEKAVELIGLPLRKAMEDHYS